MRKNWAICTYRVGNAAHGKVKLRSPCSALVDSNLYPVDDNDLILGLLGFDGVAIGRPAGGVAVLGLFQDEAEGRRQRLLVALDDHFYPLSHSFAFSRPTEQLLRSDFERRFPLKLSSSSSGDVSRLRRPQRR